MPGIVGALDAARAADAGRRRHRLGQRRPVRHPRAPIQTVAEQQFLARLELLGWIPEGDDVVEGFVHRGYFDQLNRTLAPPAVRSRSRLDPQARPPVVVNAVVLIVIEITIAL